MNDDALLVERSGADVDPAALHQAFGLAFADYLIGPFRLSPEQWPGFLARQGVDLALSRVLLGGEPQQILAFAFVAPRPEIRRWRLATMGALPAARGSGAAPRLLDGFVARAAAAGMAAVELEVFAQNERALRLYRSRGFEALHQLHGYLAAPAQVLPVAQQFEEVAAARALVWLSEQAQPGLAELPFQVTAAALSAGGWRAWQRGRAQLIFSAGPDELLTINSLIDLDPGQADARALLQALRAAHPQATLKVPQLQRLDLGGAALLELGFERLPLHQLLMVRDVG